MMNPLNQIDQLFLKATQNNLALSYIDEVKVLCKTFEGMEDFAELDMKCKRVMSTIYSLRGQYEKAFALDLQILPNMPVTHQHYWGLMYSATTNSTPLGRMDEVRPYVVAYLKEGVFNFGSKLMILKWYVSQYPSGENGTFDEFESIVSAITKTLEVGIDASLSFSERVLFLDRANHDENSRTNDLHVAMRDAKPEDKQLILNEYLAGKPLKWYRDYALKIFAK